MTGLRVLVCGGRDYADHVALYRTLDGLEDDRGVRIAAIIEGGASGADRIASSWAAMDRAVEHVRFEADWRKHGRAAGPIRNAAMVAEGKPDLVVAAPGGRGTADMVRRARDAGIEVIEVPAPHEMESGT